MVVVVLLVLAGALRRLTALLVGLAALVVVCAAAWWFLVHRGVLRWLAFALSSPVVVIVVYAVAGQLWEVVLSVVLAAAKVAAGRAALRTAGPPASPREYAAVPPAAFCDHGSEIGWREDREVWAVRPGHQARC